MYIALDSNHNRIEISKADKGKEYFCPLCGAILIVKKGKIKQHHFAHQTCLDCDEWTSDMSDWHKEWQNYFPEECREVVITSSSGEKHRADVLVDNKIVLEFQHSRMSNEEFLARNKFYVENGFFLIWLFDLRELCENNRVILNSNSVGFREYDWKWQPKTFESYDPKNGNVFVFFQLSNMKEKCIELLYGLFYYSGFSTRRGYEYTIDEFLALFNPTIVKEN